MIRPLPLSGESRIAVPSAGGGEQVIAIAELRGRYGVAALIRMHEEDFLQVQDRRGAYVHFNLERTSNEADRRYALIPILRPGRRTGEGEEVLPLVDPERVRIGLCTRVLQAVPIDAVTEELFRASLPTVATPEQLGSALLRRYAPMFPELAPEEILARGCAVTCLALEAPG
jgi:hypothetical protein